MVTKQAFLSICAMWCSLIVFGQHQPAKPLFKDQIQPLPVENMFRDEAYYQWCSSVIQDEDGQYHLFYSRWKRAYGFTGWLTHSEVAHAVSDSPAGPWTYRETVLKGRGSGHWDAITAHNPKIKFFKGKYYLYYISTNMGDRAFDEAVLVETAKAGYTHPNWKILRPNQRTGVAVASSLNGPWERLDHPLIEPSGPITTLTVNPAIARGPDSLFYLIVKGDKPGGAGARNQAVAISKSPTGPFHMQKKAVIDDMDTEDISIWFDHNTNGYYAIFHAHTFIGLMRSKDGVHWERSQEFRVLEKNKVRLANGGLLEVDRLERPFVFLENGKPRVLSLAVKKGNDAYIVFLPVSHSAP